MGQLWQLPLLLVSLGLFGYAAYLFIDPKPGLTIDQKIDIARTYLRQERPEAALEQLNRLLSKERLEPQKAGEVHLLIAESLEAGQKQRKLNVPANHERIIEETQIAMAQGIKPTADLHRRLGDSFEALGKVGDALSNFRQAMAIDAGKSMRLQKKVIELQISAGEEGAAVESIDQYARNEQVTDAEHAWAVGELAQILINRGKYSDAKLKLEEAQKLTSDPVSQGAINYRLGYCAWKLNEPEEAERLLRVARDQLRVQHPLDGDACWVLGRIYQEKHQPAEANSFYQVVLTSHPDIRVGPLALLGRGVCRIMAGEDEAGLSDLHDLTNQINQRASRARFKAEAMAGLNEAVGLLSQKGNYEGALELMQYELALRPEPENTFYAKLAGLYEKRADQVEAGIADARPADKVKRTMQVRDLRCKAGDACIAYSRALTLKDDKGYGEALWKGIDLYDRANDLQRVMSSLELFVAERPDDSMAADALLRLGRAYQAAGLFDKAITAYQRNQFRFPQSLAASRSAVPLAQTFIAKGPDWYGKAEAVLLGVFDNPALTPEAEEFKQALFEVAQLYYRTGRYEEAVQRLEEWTQRYPKEDRIGQLLFLMGDSYRKSAAALGGKSEGEAALASAGGDKDKKGESGDGAKVKGERLTKAKALFDQAIDLYRTTPPTKDIDRLYLKLSHFYRADCLYDLGRYEEAIRLYDAAAFRYQDDPSALAAYVQIVNSYCALGKMAEAKTANERAKWLLRRMPPEAFDGGGFAMPKSYWEQWLAWTSKAGMWD